MDIARRTVAILGLPADRLRSGAMTELARLLEIGQPDCIAVAVRGDRSGAIAVLGRISSAEKIILDAECGPWVPLPGWIVLPWDDDSIQTYPGQRAIARARSTGLATVTLSKHQTATIHEMATRTGVPIDLWGINLCTNRVTFAMIAHSGTVTAADVHELPRSATQNRHK